MAPKIEIHSTPKLLVLACMRSRTWPLVRLLVALSQNLKISVIIAGDIPILPINISVAKSSVIRKKGESQNGCFKKTKHAKFFVKRVFITSWYAHIHIYTCAYQGVRKVRFSENLACFVFLKTRFEIRLFAILPTKYWRFLVCIVTDLSFLSNW